MLGAFGLLHITVFQIWPSEPNGLRTPLLFRCPENLVFIIRMSLLQRPGRAVDTTWSLSLSRRLLKTIMMGQVLSLLICGTAVSCQYLASAKVETPMLQSFLNYTLLLLVYMTMLGTRKGQKICTSHVSPDGRVTTETTNTLTC